MVPERERERRLFAYAKFSYGDPAHQLEAYDRLKVIFDDRELILATENLKDIAIRKLEDRLNEADSKQVRRELLDNLVTGDPSDLKLLVEMQLRLGAISTISASLAKTPQKQPSFILAEKTAVSDTLQQSVNESVEKLAVKTQSDPTFLENNDLVKKATSTPDILDVHVVKNLDDALQKSQKATPEAIAKAEGLDKQVTSTFIANVARNDFTTQKKSTDNPVGEHTDVATLPPVPQTITLLNEVKDQAPLPQKAVIDKAISSQIVLMKEHVSEQVTDPVTFQRHAEVITNDPEVKKILIKNGESEFIDQTAKKNLVIEGVKQQQKEQLHKKMEEIHQEIFASTARGGQLQKQLPEEAQKEIEEIKKSSPKTVPAVREPTIIPPQIESIPSSIQLPIVTSTPQPNPPEKKEPPIKSPVPQEKPTSPNIPSPSPTSRFLQRIELFLAHFIFHSPLQA